MARRLTPLDAIREVGPGGHFFGAAHPMERYVSEFHVPLLSDGSSFGAWTVAGSRKALTLTHRTMTALLDSYQPPAVEPARIEAMAAFVARRKEEGGATDV